VGEARALLDQVCGRLTEEEHRLAGQCAQGQPWVEVVAQRGGSQEARRKKPGRALDRVPHELGPEDATDE
jgi:hypothetical protein